MLVNLWTQAAPAQVQMPDEMRSHFNALKEACHADFDRLCSGVLPGGHRIANCLRDHAGALSPDCAQALAAAKAIHDRASGTGE